jgi:hypothetical protein
MLNGLTPEIVDMAYLRLQIETKPNLALIELQDSFRASDLYAHMESTADRTIRALVTNGYLPSDTMLKLFQGALELGFTLGQQYQSRSEVHAGDQHLLV